MVSQKTKNNSRSITGMPVLRLRNNRSSRWDELLFDIRSDEKLEVVGTKTQASHSCSQRRTSAADSSSSSRAGVFCSWLNCCSTERKGGSDSRIFKQRCLQYAIQLSNKIFVPAQQLQRCPATAHPVRQQGEQSPAQAFGPAALPEAAPAAAGPFCLRNG